MLTKLKRYIAPPLVPGAELTHVEANLKGLLLTLLVISPLTTKTKGIGLALAVSRNLVELNDGEIEVKSIESSGSIFTMILLAIEGREVASQPDAGMVSEQAHGFGNSKGSKHGFKSHITRASSTIGSCAA